MSVNKVTLIGNLGADPEVTVTDKGMKIVRLSVATSERWTDKNSGEKKERTEWHRVAIFGAPERDGMAGVAEKYLRKGSRCYFEGKLQTRKWQDDKGIDRWTTEVVLGPFDGAIDLQDSPTGNRPPAATSPDDYGSTRTVGERPTASRPAVAGVDDDIPF